MFSFSISKCQGVSVSLHTPSRAQWQTQGAYCLECGLAPLGLWIELELADSHKSSSRCLFQMGRRKEAKRLTQRAGDLSFGRSPWWSSKELTTFMWGLLRNNLYSGNFTFLGVYTSMSFGGQLYQTSYHQGQFCEFSLMSGNQHQIRYRTFSTP